MAEISDTAMYVAAAALVLPKIIDLGFTLFKGSLNRNIETADRAQAEAKKAVAELDEKFDALDRKLERFETTHTGEKAALNTSLGSIDGRLSALDNRITMQGKHYEDKIVEGFKKLEIDLNRKLTQVVSETQRETQRSNKGRR